MKVGISSANLSMLGVPIQLVCNFACEVQCLLQIKASKASQLLLYVPADKLVEVLLLRLVARPPSVVAVAVAV
eukprot:5341818-Pyramimonas_sp.AAC.1